jgi:hypothetical protein
VFWNLYDREKKFSNWKTYVFSLSAIFHKFFLFYNSVWIRTFFRIRIQPNIRIFLDSDPQHCHNRKAGVTHPDKMKRQTSLKGYRYYSFSTAGPAVPISFVHVGTGIDLERFKLNRNTIGTVQYRYTMSFSRAWYGITSLLMYRYVSFRDSNTVMTKSINKRMGYTKYCRRIPAHKIIFFLLQKQTVFNQI